MLLRRAVVLAAPFILAACGETSPSAPAAPPAPSVVVEPVQAREVAAVSDYVGRSEASQRVEIRARVTGVLAERPFEEGSPVEAGALMFRIDPAEYEANLASARANVARAEATVEEAASNLKRYQDLVRRDAASVAKFEEAKARDATARADLEAAKATLRKAELDLGYTRITAPIAGRAGRANADVGNLIGPDSATLATIVQLDPINVIFSIGEREYLNYARNKNEGKATSLTPRLRLADGRMYEPAGKFDLIDNEVDPATGTITVRVTFPNPDRLIVPGQFVNVLLTSTEPERRVVIPQAAVQENQSGPFVLVVDADNRVAVRAIETGQRVGTAIVARSGLEAGEMIITDGIQKVRPGAVVAPVAAGAAAKARPTGS
jgi:membrane fusion protein (multidrug efflux system)